MDARWVALIVLTLARAAMGFQFQAPASVSPLLLDELAIGYAEIGFVIGLYMLPGIVLAIPGGLLGRRFLYRPHPNDRGTGAAGTTAEGISRQEVGLVCIAGMIWGLYNGAFTITFGFTPLLKDEIKLTAGRTLLLRPIRPEDEPMLIAAYHKLSPESMRLRFFAPIKELTHETAAGLTQIDYDREMALVLADHDRPGIAEIYAVARFSTDPDQEKAEFALTVRDDVTGRGFGPLLLRRLIDYARERRIGEIFGHVLRENSAMLAICRLFGFEEHADPDDPAVKLVRLPL